MTRLTYQIKCPACAGPLRASVGEDRTVCKCGSCGRRWVLGIHAATAAPVLREEPAHE